MPTYVEVAVNVPQVTGVFHYHVPAELENRCQPGHLVEVPFGRQTVQGVILRFVESPMVPETRPLLALVDAHLALTPAQITLAGQLAHDTLASMAACTGLMLPPGLSQQADTLYTLRVDQAALSARSGPPFSSLQRQLIGLLQKRGALRGRQIDQSIPKLNWRGAVRPLVTAGLVMAQPVLPPPTIRPKSVRTVSLAVSPETIHQALPGLGRAGSQALERRQKILNFLLREPGPVEAAWVYAESGGTLADLHALAERELVILGEGEVWRDPLSELSFTPSEPPPLTPDQQSALDEVCQGITEAAAGRPVSPFLLHGVTGSGKTEVYLNAVAETLRLGRQVIVMVPEISLTPQTVRRFVSRFPGRVGLVHSRLSPGERYDTWRRARLGDLSVVVGPRSALFTPFPNLGLIVVDECHDDSYYQSETPPNYHARQAAVDYARLAGAVCLLGSATPDLHSRLLAQAPQGASSSSLRYHYLHLPSRILAHKQAVQAQVERLEADAEHPEAQAETLGAEGERQRAQAGHPRIESQYRPLSGDAESIGLPPVDVVDMRQELKAGNRSIFSRQLQSALAAVLRDNQQAILFLNRRGTATYVFCRDCGYTLKCPQCDIPLTFHAQGPASKEGERSQPALLCHHCNYRRKLPKTCPECGSDRIRQYGTGTERVEEEVKALFPLARTLRWDYETTRMKGAHEAILSHFANHRADLLIGTQMLAKGLDLPLVTLVGVVLADVGLHMPDYRAAERTFQTLTQVAGRAGRSLLGGRVVLQTFEPEHYVIRAAAGHDYDAFYHQELAYRRQLEYPPYSRLARLEYRHNDSLQAQRAAESMAAQVRVWLEAEDHRLTALIGPAPCFFARLGGLHRWQILLRGPDPASILRGRALGDWRVEIDPVSLL